MPAQPSHPIHAIVPSTPLAERQFALPDEAATAAFGLRFAQALDAVRAERLAANAFDGLQIQLLGDLGAGKTTLVRAILRGLGHAGRVRSPTYTLVEPYALERADGELAVHHFDLYRFSDPAEWADAGFREYFNAGAICLVEWPQQAGTLLGVPDLVFALDVDGEGRRLVARAYSASGNACLERC
ncbi:MULTISPECIES: tRNA (adenosine(37)-N6)-threonylcarbamoyltransferase complex ATPase subunit type 1 TsaE [Burkholderia]|uniref:tRNA (adenosine(37)-N6)-threonylcarbamoyltransferase complex ATPase subunit type 1 TsaE n=1 Tax=Burkholderia TaxID=32008 RepID=UPI00119B155F|nr:MULTISPECIES: tRNA (adenosine(37)-N6)-threonylcarbamoyltransferase complex ATPase subunit type 1 TsaE [Burkholderia]MDN7741066.1 tRNA (adenosine(37)-N6)-threonylcarbamoyltransferase complex ATPase subunit type 1 TsaE [Burkholderia gladioli]TWC61700.1 tRNA threonylcarbamoyladenosine biosynthesis protein TsaE [Burkholderia sp. SJZ089]TWC95215.1 tRNA threonylcarbamoyladenosine biosynthesis protein TsaE [Burkholderia sp. SJZ115]TWC97853.1 tRNA threonylcarbamoyladenosine biosynthesis protein TsaE